MTEKFTIVNMGLDGRLIKENGKIIELERVVDLLNENEKLKRQIGNLEHTRDFCADVCADCERLEKENEQLKCKLLKLEEDRDYYKTKCGSLEDGYLKLQRENYKLKKENGQLKKEIKDLVNINALKDEYIKGIRE